MSDIAPALLVGCDPASASTRRLHHRLCRHGADPRQGPCGTLGRVPGRDRYGSQSALLVVDVQNDFADPQGSLFVQGAADIVPLINSEARLATESGAFVVYTQDWHPESTPHFAKDGGTWPVHCVAGSWGAQFHPALSVVGPSVRKGQNGEDGYSGFTMRDPVSGETVPTELEALLRDRDVRNVIVVGLATDYCISATGLDAIRLGFRTEVLQDAIASVDLEAGDGQRALGQLSAAGCSLGYCFGTLP
jgi:nicotinamidase/pyrazinamidase